MSLILPWKMSQCLFAVQIYYFERMFYFLDTQIKNGGDLLSHTVSSIVPSALKGLTFVFGMGTSVAPSL